MKCSLKSDPCAKPMVDLHQHQGILSALRAYLTDHFDQSPVANSWPAETPRLEPADRGIMHAKPSLRLGQTVAVHQLANRFG